MSREALVFLPYLEQSLQRVIDTLAALDDDAIAWQPPAEGANSRAALAGHVLANLEENVLRVLCGEDVTRHRETEFTPARSGQALRAEGRALLERMGGALAVLPGDAMDADRSHPRRGRLTGREVLIVAIRHVAEHAGQAELTRDLYHAAHRG